MKNYLKTALSRYTKNKDGNFAMMAAFTSMGLLMAASVAIDTSSLVQKNGALQDYLDAAIIAAAATGEENPEKLKKIVKESLKSNSHDMDGLTFEIDVIDKEIFASARAMHKTSMMGMVGLDEVPVNVKSAAPIAGAMPVNLALVLDTTRSMEGSNMDDLREAAKALVDIMDRSNNPETRLSVVPFNSYVNVGMGNRNAAWMDVPADGPGPARSCYDEWTTGTTGCQESMVTNYKDGVPFQEMQTTGCDSVKTGNMICPPPDNLVWKGCAGSRLDGKDELATATASDPIPGAMKEYCGNVEILPLTDDMDDVRDTIDDLMPTNDTYIPAGLAWGWRTLSPTAPFSEAASTPKHATRAIILMTDGANTMDTGPVSWNSDRVYHKSYSPSNTTADDLATDRILALCSNAKADGITIYTVAYKIPSALSGGHDVLRDCASSRHTAFKANSMASLKSTFEKIGRNLQVVRLSK